MLNELLCAIRQNKLLQPGDQVVCAVSGGADSVALLWGLFLLKDKLQIELSAAHYNHGLRGAESDGDEAFVRRFCAQYDIPLQVGSGRVVSGPKGLEAAARDARYAFLETLPGKIATAHTADDNAETVLMHLIRGTGLKGLGGIAPVRGRVIRPMLNITRQQVLDFLQEYHLSWVEDSSNGEDTFLRNRVRHHVMPLLRRENPRFAEKTSATAQRLRQDEEALIMMTDRDAFPKVEEWKALAPALRSRMLERFLKQAGVREPEAEHIAQAEALLYSPKPSAKASFPGGVTVCRVYDQLQVQPSDVVLAPIELPREGVVELPQLSLRICCGAADQIVNNAHTFTLATQGPVLLRSRQSADVITLSGGTKSLKKLFIDCKIPAYRRQQIPVLCDREGILGVYGIGADQKRIARELPAWQIRIEKDTGGNDNGKGYSADPDL